MGVFGRGVDAGNRTERQIREEQDRARRADGLCSQDNRDAVNQAAHPNRVTLAELRQARHG